MAHGRAGVSRVFMLLFGTAGNAGIAFLTQLILTRKASVSDYGSLSALIAAVTLLTPVAGLCIGWFWLELYGREGKNAVRWGRPALKLSAVTMTVASALLALYVLLSSNSLLGSPASTWLSACMILVGQTLSETRAVRLQLEERYTALAVWQVLPQILRSASVAGLTMAGQLTGPNALSGYALAGLIVAIVSFSSLMKMSRGNVILGGHIVTSSLSQSPATVPGVVECFKSALPYSLVTLFFLIYSLGIVAMVGLLIGKEAVAFYNVSYLIFTSLCILPSVVYTKYLAAKIFRWWTNDRKMLIAAFHLGIFIHLILGVFFGGIVAFSAPFIIPLLFGKQYGPAVAVMQILALAVPIRFVQHGYGAMLFSREHIRKKVLYMGIAAVLSAVWMVLLTPQFGVRGAAVAAVLSELVLLLLYMLAAARHVEGVNVRATFHWATLVAAHKYATGHGKDA